MKKILIIGADLQINSQIQNAIKEQDLDIVVNNIEEQKEQLNITVVSSRFDDIYTHPFRVGRKQGKAVLDAKGLQVVFMATEKQAQMYCTYLNGY